MKKIFFLCLLSLFLIDSQGQVVIDNTQTVEYWVQNVLVGEGVTVSNVMVNGVSGDQVHVQVGGFDDPSEDVGLSDGFVMGTGNVTMASQPNTGGGNSLPGAGDNYSFAPLEDLSAFSVNDQCIVEFDFVPQGDTLNFNYTFASEEYEEYVCGTVNDVFGFFISGPNPGGGNYANENLALIPDPNDPGQYTSTPVSINTLNPGVAGSNGNAENCDNADPNWASYNVFYTANTTNTYEYDGRSVLLTAQALVECGGTYHIVLAIGDGGDTAFDSAVFLEGGSFSSTPTGITAESLFPLGLVEISSECDSGYAQITRTCSGDSLFYHLNYLVNDSTAEYGVDYLAATTDTFMIPGQQILYFPLQAIPDGIEEDAEYICIEMSESATGEDGSFVITDTACVAIVDNYTFPVTVLPDEIYCPNNLPQLSAVPEFPAVPPFTFSWSQDGVTELSAENPFITELPPQWDSAYYMVEVVDLCGASGDSAGAFVYNKIPDYPEVSISGGEYCPGVPLPLICNRNGGTAPHTYIWTDEFGETYDNSWTIDVDPIQIYGPIEQLTYKVVYEDNCDPTRTDSAEYTVIFPEPLSTEAFMNSAICTDQILEITTSSAGGYPPYSYTWTSTPDLGPNIHFPVDFGFVNGPDGSASASGFWVDEALNSDSDFLINLELNDWCSEQSNIFFAAFDTDTVTALDCIYPNVVTPNEDGDNDSFLINELINRKGTMFIYNRWGNLLAETTSHEWKIGDEAEGTYYYVVQFDDNDDDNKRTGYFTVLR